MTVKGVKLKPESFFSISPGVLELWRKNLRGAPGMDRVNDTNTSTLAMKRVHSLYTEIFKSLNNLNAPYMKDLFHRNVSTYSLRSSNDLLVPRVNQTTFGSRSTRYKGAVMWNHLPKHIKTAENIASFKKLTRNWKMPQCKCAHCKYANENTDHS